MKGIILAGGKGSRLYPITKLISKHLLPIYDKPLIYYPLSVLFLAKIRNILLISTSDHIYLFKKLLRDGKHLGINLRYSIQKEPKGIAEAFIIAEDFIGKDDVCLILGDNIFYGHGLPDLLKKAKTENKGATIFAYYVKNPQKYGVLEFDTTGKITSIKEKPKNPKSNWVVTGLYFYNNEVIKIAKKIKPSKRGELEITGINNEYLKKGQLETIFLGRGYAWLDAGDSENLIKASIFIKTIEERQGLKIGCIEEIAYRVGFINKKQLKKLAEEYPSTYREYLLNIL